MCVCLGCGNYPVEGVIQLGNIRIRSNLEVILLMSVIMINLILDCD